MALPEGFSPWEHLQTTLNQVQNRIVREEFRDVGDDNWEPNITTARASLRVASTLTDNDSAIQSLIRLIFFYVVLRKARDLQAPIYGIPLSTFQSERKFKPQICLYFSEPSQDVESDYNPMEGRISFRLMNQETDTLTLAELKNYANRIKTSFATGNGYFWNKGKTMISYSDWEKGYQLQLLCRNETDGRNLIEKILDIQSHTPQWEKMAINENAQPTSRYPIVPMTKLILGKSRRLPRERPIGRVKFRHAVCHLHGLPNPQVLLDLTGTLQNPLVKL